MKFIDKLVNAISSFKVALRIFFFVFLFKLHHLAKEQRLCKYAILISSISCGIYINFKIFIINFSIYSLKTLNTQKNNSGILFFSLVIIYFFFKNLEINENLALTFLVSTNFNKIIKRNMMAAGSHMSVAQKQAAATIFSLHIKMLKQVTVTGIDFLKNISEGIVLHGKIYQHMITSIYGNIIFNTDFVRKHLPGVDIFDDSKGYVDLDCVIAAVSASHIIKKPPFLNGKFKVLSNPEKIDKNLDSNSPSFQQTKQLNPDYLFDNKNPLWQRYMDLKTGKMNVDRCHITITNDFTEYVKKSYQIFVEQKTRYADLYPGSKLVDTIDLLDKNKSIPWDARYTKFLEYLADNLQDYPKINPSVIFHVTLSYNIQNYTDKKYDGIFSTDSFIDNESSREFLHSLIEKEGSTVVANFMKISEYKYYNPLGLGKGYGKAILRMISDVLY